MFNIITQRLLWKEFRAQQLVWIAIAGELLLLQFWWGIKGHEYADLNLFSMAFVLTGVFAMTTSALLFAGESEAKTDLFLRQLPITPRQLIGGKLLYGGLAVVAFLLFALLSTFIAGQMAGKMDWKYGGGTFSLMSDPSVFALSIVGLGAWGLFYSLLTRKVLWTVIGAALTEIIIGGLIHSLILESAFWVPDWVFYVIYAAIIAVVVAVDARMLMRWCTSEATPRSNMITTIAESGPVTCASESPLPWLSAYRWCCGTGIVAAIFALVLTYQELVHQPQGMDTGVTQLIFAGSAILASLLSFTLSRLRHTEAPFLRIPSSLRAFLLRPTWQRSREMAGLCGTCGMVYLFGFIACFFLLAPMICLLAGQTSVQNHWTTPLMVAACAISSIWLGDLWIRSANSRKTTGWMLALQMIHAIPQRAARRLGPLLWIEARRALPVLLIGWVLLTLMGWFRWDMREWGALSYFAIVLAALVCGLLTLLPDRSHGTLAFLTERGVSSTKIILCKVFVWGGTLLLLLIPPLVQGRVWGLFDYGNPNIPQQAIPHNVERLSHQGDPFIVWVDAPSPANHLFVLLLGTFTIGVLAAAWVRRPILAGILGFSLMLPWFGFCAMLRETYAPIGFTALFPIVLVGLAILWTGSRTLLEQSSWRSKFGQIGWVLLVGFVGLQGYFHFRANEVFRVADDEVMNSIRNGQPSPLGKTVSSWMYPFDESVSHASQLDSLVDDESKRNSLVQPAGLWNAPNSFQMGIESLKLDQEACDLDAAFEHLRKWLSLTEQLAYASRDEDGWVDALVGRRVVLSAIRKWANHPQQTAERLESATTKLTPNQIGMSGATVIARQYADARRALDMGISSDSSDRRGLSNASPVTQWLLARTGEKERVRRLIDYYFLLSADTRVSQPSTTGTEFDHWSGTTHASATTLGVSLPWQRLNVRHHGQFELAMTAENATRLVLQLQAWRLKHGSFPASFADVMTETGPINTHDFLTNEAFHYEPQGFDRDLLVVGVDDTFRDSQTRHIVPAKQPILYSMGIELPRGVELIPDPRIEYHDGIRPLVYRSRNSLTNQPARATKSNSQGPPRSANPNTIRFSIFGQLVDEDSLYQAPHERDPDPILDEGGMGAGGMSSGMESGETAIEAPLAPDQPATTPEPM